MDKHVTGGAILPVGTVDKAVSLVSVSTSHILINLESPAQIKWHKCWSQFTTTKKQIILNYNKFLYNYPHLHLITLNQGFDFICFINYKKHIIQNFKLKFGKQNPFNTRI